MTAHSSYTPTQKFLHWFIGLAFILLICVGFIMTSLPDSDIKWFYYMMHKSFGTILFLLVLWRVYLRLKNTAPRYPKTLTPFHLALAKTSVPVLYACIITIPLSGIVMSIAGGHPISIFNLVTIPALNPKIEKIASLAHLIHTEGIFLVIGIFVLHVCAAFYHHLVLKNDILNHMMPEVRK